MISLYLNCLFSEPVQSLKGSNYCFVFSNFFQAWLGESQPSNPATRVRLSAESEILIFILRLSACPLCSVLCCLWWWPWHCADHSFREAHHCIFIYSGFTIARGFKVKSLSLPLHTQWSGPNSLNLRSRTHNYVIAASGGKRVTNCYVRYLQAAPLNGLSRDCHRSYVVSSGSSTAGKSGHLYILETFRGNENAIVFLSTGCFSPFRHLAHRLLGFKSRGM